MLFSKNIRNSMNTKNMPISIRKLSILAVFLQFCCCAGVWAQPDPSLPFHHPNLDFDLNLSAAFEQVEIKDQPGLGLALKKKGLDFPTFNVISEAASFEPGLDVLQNQAKAVRDTYRKLGLTGVKIKSKKLIEVQSGSAHRIDLSYKNQAQEFIAVVVLVPGEARHFILTYIDRAKDYSQNEAELTALLSSFKIPDHARSSGKALSFPSVWVVILVLMLLVLAFRFQHRPS